MKSIDATHNTRCKFKHTTLHRARIYQSAQHAQGPWNASKSPANGAAATAAAGHAPASHTRSERSLDTVAKLRAVSQSDAWVRQHIVLGKGVLKMNSI